MLNLICGYLFALTRFYIQGYRSLISFNENSRIRVSECLANRAKSVVLLDPPRIERSLRLDRFNRRLVASSHEAFGTCLELHWRESCRGNARRHGGAHYAGRDANAADTAGRHGVSSGFLLYVYHCKQSANDIRDTPETIPRRFLSLQILRSRFEHKKFQVKVCILQYLKLVPNYHSSGVINLTKCTYNCELYMLFTHI